MQRRSGDVRHRVSLAVGIGGKRLGILGWANRSSFPQGSAHAFGCRCITHNSPQVHREIG